MEKIDLYKLGLTQEGEMNSKPPENFLFNLYAQYFVTDPQNNLPGVDLREKPFRVSREQDLNDTRPPVANLDTRRPKPLKTVHSVLYNKEVENLPSRFQVKGRFESYGWGDRLRPASQSNLIPGLAVVNIPKKALTIDYSYTNRIIQISEKDQAATGEVRSDISSRAFSSDRMPASNLVFPKCGVFSDELVQYSIEIEQSGMVKASLWDKFSFIINRLRKNEIPDLKIYKITIGETYLLFNTRTKEIYLHDVDLRIMIADFYALELKRGKSAPVLKVHIERQNYIKEVLKAGYRLALKDPINAGDIKFQPVKDSISEICIFETGLGEGKKYLRITFAQHENSTGADSQILVLMHKKM